MRLAMWRDGTTARIPDRMRPCDLWRRSAALIPVPGLVYHPSDRRALRPGILTSGRKRRAEVFSARL
eukprot:2034686-Pleurochrysis_carterae.AAC.1